MLKAEAAVNRQAERGGNSGLIIPACFIALPAVPESSSGFGRPAKGPPWPLQLLDALWPVFQPHSGHISAPVQVPGLCGSVLPALPREGGEKAMKSAEMKKGLLSSFLEMLHSRA